MQQLAQQMRQLEQSDAIEQAGCTGRVISTGIAPLDAMLPGGGIRSGTLLECLSHSAGSGATMIALTVAVHATEAGGSCVVIDRQRTFFPAAWPVAASLNRLVVVHPASDRDMLWTLEQSLRCSEVAAVVCWAGLLQDHAYRRLQLAVETGGGTGLLLRSSEHLSSPSWAGIRLLFQAQPAPDYKPPAAQSAHGEVVSKPVSGIGAFSTRLQPLPGGGGQPAKTRRLLRIELIHCRGRAHGAAVELEIDDETGDVHLASELAGATATLRSASL